MMVDMDCLWRTKNLVLEQYYGSSITKLLVIITIALVKSSDHVTVFFCLSGQRGEMQNIE